MLSSVTICMGPKRRASAARHGSPAIRCTATHQKICPRSLLLRGWSSRSLLLSEVALQSGEHHLVLMVRVKGVDLVPDNLNDDIRVLAATFGEYQWIKIQAPQNPKLWDNARIVGI